MAYCVTCGIPTVIQRQHRQVLVPHTTYSDVTVTSDADTHHYSASTTSYHMQNIEVATCALCGLDLRYIRENNAKEASSAFRRDAQSSMHTMVIVILSCVGLYFVWNRWGDLSSSHKGWSLVGWASSTVLTPPIGGYLCARLATTVMPTIGLIVLQCAVRIIVWGGLIGLMLAALGYGLGLLVEPGSERTSAVVVGFLGGVGMTLIALQYLMNEIREYLRLDLLSNEETPN